MKNGKLQVYITVDTETSLGGAWRNPAYSPLPVSKTVFGECGSGQYGIPLIMDILEPYGFRATFFTEVFCAYNLGYGEVEKVFRYIRRRGHDAQLHLHPIQRFYRDRRAGLPAREIDLMFRLSPAEQRELIAEGVGLFRQLSGTTPRAFRAGCFGAAETTLAALRENGISIDSSYNLAYLDRSCGFRTRPLNAPVEIENVREFPITVFRVAGLAGYKPLDIAAVSTSEILHVLRRLREAGCGHAVLILHSFSLLKKRGVQYDRHWPDRIVIRRFRKLCAALWQHRDEMEVAVLGEAAPAETLSPHPQVIPSPGWLRPSMRKLCQAVNRLPWI